VVHEATCYLLSAIGAIVEKSECCTVVSTRDYEPGSEDGVRMLFEPGHGGANFGLS
jgi:hypothetical protein